MSLQISRSSQDISNAYRNHAVVKNTTIMDSAVEDTTSLSVWYSVNIGALYQLGYVFLDDRYADK